MAPVWAHFSFKPDKKGWPKDVDTALCRICKREIPVKGANTTNLGNHLKTHHPTEFAEGCKASTTKWHTLTDSVTWYI